MPIETLIDDTPVPVKILTDQIEAEADEYFANRRPPSVIASGETSKALHQLGTLGGGNHFIEVCIDDADQAIWLMLHSGSRNIGKTVAERHINTAKKLLK